MVVTVGMLDAMAVKLNIISNVVITLGGAHDKGLTAKRGRNMLHSITPG